MWVFCSDGLRSPPPIWSFLRLFPIVLQPVNRAPYIVDFPSNPSPIHSGRFFLSRPFVCVLSQGHVEWNAPPFTAGTAAISKATASARLQTTTTVAPPPLSFLSFPGCSTCVNLISTTSSSPFPPPFFHLPNSQTLLFLPQNVWLSARRRVGFDQCPGPRGPAHQCQASALRLDSRAQL